MAKGFTLEEMKAMGAKPVATSSKGYTLEELKAMGAKPAVVVSKEVVQPKTNKVKDFITSTSPSFKASEGGVSSIPKNIAKTVANIPSSARNIVRAAIAPVNPFDTESPINIGANFVKSIDSAKELVRDNGVVGAYKAYTSGVGSVLGNAAKKTGEFTAKQSKEAIQNPAQYASNAVKVGVEDPLLLPSLLYGGPKAVGAKTTDVVSDVANAVTRGADTKVSNIMPKIKNAIGDTSKQLTQRSEKAIEKNVLAKYEKGVKPLIPGKTTPQKMNAYKADVMNAVKTIKDNKSSLKFIDENGVEVVGESPKSLQQFSEAIEQTKRSVFSNYDRLAKEAGEAGVTVKMNPIAQELDTVINNKALSLTNPKAIKYAEELKDRLTTVGDLDAVTSQEVIQNYNKSLEAFYRNPSYDNASQAAIDSMVANRMRQSLDEGITGLTGEQYQILKKQYGSLKAIEKDVIKAALRDARKNTKGLIDFTDIFSGGQVATGILTLNPSVIAQGFTQKAITEFYKHLNNPNRAIQKMFETVEEVPRATSYQSKSTNTVTGKFFDRYNATPNKEGGFVKIPGRIHSDDVATLRDFSDYVNGSYTPNQKMVVDLEIAARRIVEKYGITNPNVSNRVLATQIGPVIDAKLNLGSTDRSIRDEFGKFKGSNKKGLPKNKKP